MRLRHRAAENATMKKAKRPPPGPRRTSEGGFSLIEVLVVIVIISILAAISIPIFVHQREKGWRAQVESALKNGATAMQAWGTENDGDYTLPSGVGPDAADDMDWLTDEGGWSPTADVTLDIVIAQPNRFCLAGTHAQLDSLQLDFDSQDGRPVDGDCS